MSRIKFTQPLPPPIQVGLELGGKGVLQPAWANVFQSWSQVLTARGFPCEVENANVAISIKDGTFLLGGTGALAMTIAAPVQGPISGISASPQPQVLNGDDMKTLLIFSTTAFAHTVTGPANVYNGSLHIATWAGAIGNYIRFFAYNGILYSLDSNGVTLT